MAVGTYSGGWRIIHTLGSKVIKLDPIHGFAAETSAATVIQIATHFGFPVSTTHTITAAIMGVGATRRLSAVRWGVASNIVFAWVLTLPAAGAASPPASTSLGHLDLLRRQRRARHSLPARAACYHGYRIRSDIIAGPDTCRVRAARPLPKETT